MKRKSESQGEGVAFIAWLNDQESADTVREAATRADLPSDKVQLGGLQAALEFLENHDHPAPKTLLVDVSDRDDVLEVMNRLADACEPQTHVIAMGSLNDIETYRRLLAMGLTEYLVKPSGPDAIAAALDRTRSALGLRIRAQEQVLGTIALIGTRGGVGTTSIAISIACALAHKRQLNTVLLDLDLQLGSVAISLDLEPSRGLREILENPDRIDSLLVGSALTQESERLRVLSAEESLDSEIRVDADALEALLHLLRQDNSFVVMDVSRRFDSLTQAALKQADTICVVTDLSLSGMRDSKRVLTLARNLQPESAILLIANRVAGVAGEVPQVEFERGAGVEFDFVVPHDEKAAAAAADRGRSLLASGASGPLQAELDRLVMRLSGGGGVAAPQATRSWVKRLIGS